MKQQFFRLVIFAIFLFKGKNSFCQIRDFTSKIVHTKTGVKIDFSDQMHFFSLTIDGKTVKILPDIREQKYISVDGQILQYLVVPFPAEMDYSKLDLKHKKDFLLGYESYEMESIKDQFKIKDLILHQTFQIYNNDLFLFWVFDMPKQYKDVRQQCYLITVCYDHMLVLNSPNSDDKSVNTFDFILKVGTTLKKGK